jgi:sugar (pentulose or hexulose) kinase
VAFSLGPQRIARELNLPKDVLVVVGGHDQCCGSLGVGVYQAGKTVCALGSFEILTTHYDHIPDLGTMFRHGLDRAPRSAGAFRV